MSETHDHPAEPGLGRDELFIEFANTLAMSDGQPQDRVADPAALRDWLRGHAVPTSRVTLAQIESGLPAFHELRGIIRGVVARLADGHGPTQRQLRSLNRALRDGVHYHQLNVSSAGDRFCVGQVGDDLAQARSAIANSLAHYFADHDLDRLRICADDGCRWLFVDHSPAGRRRWCDMRTCGNRAKVARHRARLRLAGAAAPR